MQLGNGRWETAEYNNRLQITKIGLGTIDSTKDLLELDYDYNTSGNHDNNGGMLKQTIKVPGVSPDFVQTYTYDALNRLSAAEEKQSTTTTWKQEFSYDRYGNRNFVTGSGHTTTLGSCSTAVCNPTISTSTNRISSSGYTFDANGNMTANAAGERFGYDAENHQKEFYTASNSGSTPDATYYYDGDGKRVKKVSSSETTIFVYDGGGQVVAEYSTALATTQQVSYLTQDHLGSPRVVTNENGAVTSRKDYAAFGEETSTSQRVSGLGYVGSSDELRKGYTGYEKDSESGLDYAQARYYNPTHGRYTSVDPMTASASIRNPQSFNRYSYVLNSPYKFTDPLGLVAWSVGGACGSTCPGSTGYIDGSSIRGRDATYDWVPELVQGLVASSENANHEPIPLTSKDRKALQKNLDKLAPGAFVTKTGSIFTTRGNSVGYQLLSAIGNSGRNLIIVVNHRKLESTEPIDANGHLNLNGYAPNVISDARVFWDPDDRASVNVIVGHGKIISSPSDPALVLGHELIHALHQMRPGNDGALDFTYHRLQEGNDKYMEDARVRELRAVGLGGNQNGDITENRLRIQLGKPLRISYLDRGAWVTCGGFGSPC